MNTDADIIAQLIGFRKGICAYFSVFRRVCRAAIESFPECAVSADSLVFGRSTFFLAYFQAIKKHPNPKVQVLLEKPASTYFHRPSPANYLRHK